MLLLILIPYMVMLFFNGGSGGLFSNTLDSTETEEQVLHLLSEEISGQSELEAIKAQAVIARTELYLNPELEVMGNDTNLLENVETLQFCVEETAGEILVCEGKPIDPAFHAVSGKITRNASEVVGQEDKVYLQSVESLYDISSPDYLVITYMEKAELAAKMQELIDATQATGNAKPEVGETTTNTEESTTEAETPTVNAENQTSDTSASNNEKITVNPETILTDLVIEERDSAEYVTKVRYQNVTINGEALRAVLGLSSSNFYLSELDGKVRIMTKGLGHGLGLSQYGANAEAAEGKKYKEILKYYYTGVEIEEVNSK